MNRNEKIKKKLKVGLCKIFWYLFILQSLYIIYSISPRVKDPIITMIDNIATLSGPNLVQEGKISDKYTIVLHQDLHQDINITLAYSSTATEGQDFIPVKEIQLKKGEFSKSFTIRTIDDLLKEDNDVYSVKIKTIRGHNFLKDYNASELSGVVFTKIVDENRPTRVTNIKVEFDKEVYENQIISYTLFAKKALLEDLIFEYEVSSTDNQKYKKFGKVLFKKGTKIAHFTIAIKDDNIIEKSQYLEIKFKSVSSSIYESVKLDKNVLKTVIVDEKNPITQKGAELFLTTPDLKTDKVYEDSENLKILLHSTQKVLQNLPLEVYYITQAVDGKDFISVKKIILEKGTKELTFNVKIINDNIRELDQKFILKLATLGKGGLENIEAKKPLELILSDEKTSLDSAVLSFFGPLKVLESEISGKYTLSLTEPVTEDLEVYLSYDKSSAKEGVDFLAQRSVKISKGENSASFTITTIDDEDIEKLEEININIQSFKGGGLERIRIGQQKEVKTQLSDELDITKAFKNLITNKKIVFEMGSDKILKESYPSLKKIAMLLEEFPKVVLIIEGHTNHLGLKKHNVELSQRRAQNVKKYIIKEGVKEKRLLAVGYGDSQPMVPIDSTNAIELNKRVDFILKYREKK